MTDLPKREPLTALQHENREAAERESAAIKQDIQRRMEKILARLKKEKSNDSQNKTEQDERDEQDEQGDWSRVESKARRGGGDDRIVL